MNRVVTGWGKGMLALVVMSLVACAAPNGGPPGAVPSPSMAAPAASPISAEVPEGGVSLAQLGFDSGPAGLVTVPAGVLVGQRVDQPNVVTATFEKPTYPEIARWLRRNLPAAGFHITADGADSLLFEGMGWQGAFTGSGDLSALTLRRGPGLGTTGHATRHPTPATVPASTGD